MILSYALYVLTPKYDFGICSMMNLYAQPPNSIDVLAVGSSLLYSDRVPVRPVMPSPTL